MNQFHSMFTEYQKHLDKLVVQFLATPAGLHLQELVQAELERCKNVPFASMADFTNGIARPTDVLKFNGRLGLEITAFQICNIHRRPLPFLQLDPSLNESTLNNWIAGPNKMFWLSHLASATLRDVVSLVMMKVLALGDVKEVTAKSKESRFGDCSWRNRGTLGRTVKLPLIDDWANRVRFFAANYNYPPDPRTALIGNDIHKYFVDHSRPASTLVIDKNNQASCAGDGSAAQLFTAINKQMVGTTTPSVYRDEAPAQTNTPITVEQFYEEDSFIEENPEAVEEITKAQEEANRERCKALVIDLEAAGASHNFKKPENFEHLVKFFNIINTPPDEEHTRMSRAFAMLSYRGQAQLFKANAHNVLFNLSKIGAQLEEDQKQVRAAIDEVDDPVAVIQRTLEFMSRIKSNRIALDEELKTKQATHDRLHSLQKSANSQKFDLQSALAGTYQQPVALDSDDEAPAVSTVARNQPIFPMAPPATTTPATPRYDNNMGFQQVVTPTTPCPPNGRGRSNFTRDTPMAMVDKTGSRLYMEKGGRSMSRDVSTSHYPSLDDDGYAGRSHLSSRSRSRSKSHARRQRDARRYNKYGYEEDSYDSYDSYDSNARYERRHTGSRHHHDHKDRSSRSRQGHRDRRDRERDRRSPSPRHHRSRKRRNDDDEQDVDQTNHKKGRTMSGGGQIRLEERTDGDEYSGSESTDEIFDRLEKEEFASSVAAAHQLTTIDSKGDNKSKEDDKLARDNVIVLVDQDDTIGGNQTSNMTPVVTSAPATSQTSPSTSAAPTSRVNTPLNTTTVATPASTGTIPTLVQPSPTGSSFSQNQIQGETTPSGRTKPPFVAPAGFMGIDKQPR